MKILVVDDDPKLRKLVARYLQAKGFGVVEAEDGVQGIEAAKKVKFGLIITDLNMPVVSGFEVIQAVKETSLNKDTPVIVLTAEDGPTNYGAIYDAGADAYVAKPVDFERLLGRVLEFV